MTRIILFLFFAFINIVQAYIFRLPCLRHANFTKFAVNHYFHGTVISTFESLERDDCVLNCVSHDTCAFFNYANQNKTCELFDNAEGDIIQRIGTDIFYAKSFPMVNYGENGCGVNTAKFLDCSVTGYTCKLLKNEALGKTAEASSFVANHHIPNFITDGNWLKFSPDCWVSSKSPAAHWIMLDVGVSVDVIFVELINVPSDACGGTCDDRLFDFNVTIGNNKEPTTENDLCLFSVNQANILQRKYDCLGGVTPGRYISVKQNEGVSNRRLNFCELRVYAVDQE